jgi:hypothetical protein
MLLINNKIDLNKSFEKLKQELKEAANGIKAGNQQSYAHSFGRLETAVKIHLIACTDTDMKQIQDYLNDDGPDDLKNLNI